MILEKLGGILGLGLQLVTYLGALDQFIGSIGCLEAGLGRLMSYIAASLGIIAARVLYEHACAPVGVLIIKNQL